MAVGTLTKKRTRVEPEEEVETKAEPEVIVDKGLAGLLKEWDQADKKAEAYWPRIVQYVIENEISKEMLIRGLIQLRHMAEMTARNEVSKIFKASQHPDLVEQAVDKKITVRELRDAVTTKQAGTDDPEVKLKKRLRGLASDAISDPEIAYAENQWIREAKKAYGDAYTKIEAKAAKADEDEEGGEAQIDEEEE